MPPANNMTPANNSVEATPPVPFPLELASTLHRYLAGRPAAEAGRLFFAVEDALLAYQADAQRPKTPARRARRRTRPLGQAGPEDVAAGGQL